MQRFLNAIEQTKHNFESGDFYQGIVVLNEGLDALIENYEPVTQISAPTIKSLVDAIDAVEIVIRFPEIEETVYLKNIIQSSKSALEGFLKGNIDDRSFLDKLKPLHKIVQYLLSIARYLEQNGHILGSSDNPPLCVALTEDGNISLYGKLSANNEGLTLEDAAILQQEFLAASGKDGHSASRLLNLAARMMTARQFEEAINAYLKICAKFPEEKSNCYNCVGACYYYLQQFEEAIDYYMKALDEGESLQRIDFNVWECCDQLIKQTTERNTKMKWKFFYEEHFPNGKFEIKI